MVHMLVDHDFLSFLKYQCANGVSSRYILHPCLFCFVFVVVVVIVGRRRRRLRRCWPPPPPLPPPPPPLPPPPLPPPPLLCSGGLGGGLTGRVARRLGLRLGPRQLPRELGVLGSGVWPAEGEASGGSPCKARLGVGSG